jgi:hypothetical protein
MIVTLYPGDFMGIRLAKTRREETITLEAVYETAIRGRVMRERMEKMNAKKNGYRVKRGRL